MSNARRKVIGLCFLAANTIRSEFVAVDTEIAPNDFR